MTENLPFIATENILMEGVKHGGDRQVLHKKIRDHSMAAAKVIKEDGGQCDLLERIVKDPAFNLTMEDMLKVLRPENYIGRAPEQVDEFLDGFVSPVLEGFSDEASGDLKV